MVIIASAVFVDGVGRCTPLHWAAIQGHKKVVSVLMRGEGTKATVISDKSGLTPSMSASKYHKHSCRSYIKECLDREAKRGKKVMPSSFAAFVL